MGVVKTVREPGTGPQPTKGQIVTIQYTGWIKDATKDDLKGRQFDTSTTRDDGYFRTRIGVGQVIRGWDEEVINMKVGEKATLDISSDFAYGSRGFTDLIPPHSDLIFDVELKKVQ